MELFGGDARQPARRGPDDRESEQPDGTVSAADLAWMGRLADDGYGTIITAAAAVSTGSICVPQPALAGRQPVPARSDGAGSAYQPRGALSIAQRCYHGARAIPELDWVAAEVPAPTTCLASPVFQCARVS